VANNIDVDLASGRKVARLRSIDSLRVALTVGVIATHSVITYGTQGSWFYREGGLSPNLSLALGLPVAVGSLFAMGLFFFIAGGLLPASLARKGTRQFLAHRCGRLGWPVLVFVICIVPLIEYLVGHTAGPERTLRQALADQARHLDAGPLWFVWVLLVFSVVAGVVVGHQPVARTKPLRPRLLILFALAIAASSFVIRLWLPVDSYQIGAAHVWQWGQCGGLFVMGVVAARQGWFARVPPNFVAGSAVGIALGVVALGGLVAISVEDLDPLGGGWQWRSAAVAAIEGVVAVGAAIVFTSAIANPHWLRIGDALASKAYGAYLLQAPVLVGLALLLRPTSIGAGVKLAALLPVSLLFCFGGAAMLRRVPGLNRIL
jgi:peptidoglycan/LPS O-acetylase OafA/YrhL